MSLAQCQGLVRKSPTAPACPGSALVRAQHGHSDAAGRGYRPQLPHLRGLARQADVVRLVVAAPMFACAPGGSTFLFCQVIFLSFVRDKTDTIRVECTLFA